MKFDYGPYAFVASGTVSGYAPTAIGGPNRQSYVIEHQVPAREGGVMEYLGSEQPRYSLKGFVSPSQNGPFNGTAAAVLSGSAYVSVNADDAKNFLVNLRGSGAQLLRIESTSSNMSGYMDLYENGFFYIEKMTFGFEAGRTYPYYPYGIDLRGASISTYGSSSGINTFAGDAVGYFSGILRAFKAVYFTNGMTKTAPLMALGLYAKSVASGNAMTAVYDDASPPNLLAASASQAVHSGWNYFPLRPSVSGGVLISGTSYWFAFLSDSTSASGWATLYNIHLAEPISNAQSGVAYGSFPATMTLQGTLSGSAYQGVFVTP